jgi:hypothetical protein
MLLNSPQVPTPHGTVCFFFPLPDISFSSGFTGFIKHVSSFHVNHREAPLSFFYPNVLQKPVSSQPNRHSSLPTPARMIGKEVSTEKVRILTLMSKKDPSS